MHTAMKWYLLYLVIILSEYGHTKGSREVGRPKKEQFKIGRRTARGEVFENLFVIYDSSFLSLVWPKISNGVHLLIEQACWDDVSVFFRHYSESRAWAYKAVDASGRYHSSLFNGDRFWLGSKDQCLRMDHDYTSRTSNETYEDLQNRDYLNAVFRREKYYDHAMNDWRWVARHEEISRRTAAADSRPPFRLAYTAVLASLNITKPSLAKFYEITVGVCMPRSCTPDDIKSIINFSIMINDNLKSNKTTPRIAKVSSLRLIADRYDIISDTGAIALIVITFVLILLAIVATVTELDLKCIPYNSNKMSFDLQKYSGDDKATDTEKRKRKETMQGLDNMEKLAKMEQIAMKLKSKVPPPITLDVMMDRHTNCKRCGKYKKQCHPSIEHMQACSQMQYSTTRVLGKDVDRDKSLLRRLLLCFSISYCWNRIFNKNTANKDLALIHGLKIFATLWVIYVHVALMATSVSDKTDDLNNREGAYWIVATGTIAFDILFFVSGLFSSHHFFYLKSRYSVEELVSCGGACGQVMQFVCFVTNRLIRLLPSYAFAAVLSGVVARASRATSALTLPDSDHDTCARYWWRNLLYITTAYPAREQCMPVAWYLSTETQLHVACALLGAGGGARLAAAAGALAALAAAAVDITSAHIHRTTTYTDVYDLYWSIVARPWARVTPYLTGVLAGWLIHKRHGKIHVSSVSSSLLWVLSLLLLLASAAVPWAPNVGLAAWAHVTLPLALLWPAVLVSAKYAAWSGRMHGAMSAAASRLCAGAILLHAPLARVLLLSADSTLCAHSVCIWMYYSGIVVMTFLSALVLAVLVEMPCCSLLRRLSDCVS